LDEAGERGLTSKDLANRIACNFDVFRECVPESINYQKLFGINNFDLKSPKLSNEL